MGAALGMDSSILEMSVGPAGGVTLDPETVLAYEEIASFTKTQKLQDAAKAANGLGSMLRGAGTYSHVQCMSLDTWALCSGRSGMLITACMSCCAYTGCM